MEAGRHLETQRQRREDQQDTNNSGVVGRGDRGQPRLAERAGYLAPRTAEDGSSRQSQADGQRRDRAPGMCWAVLRAQMHGKESHLASLLPWVDGAS